MSVLTYRSVVLRAVAEGKIRWAFWPPDTPLSVVEEHHLPGGGIWISDSDSTTIAEDELDSDEEAESEGSGESEKEDPNTDDESRLTSKNDLEMEDKDESGLSNVVYTRGRFSALVLEAVDDPNSERTNYNY